MKILKEIPYYRLCSLIEWRMVKGHPRYAVSCNGDVLCWKWHRTGKPRICKLTKNGNGYLHVGIDGKTIDVHRLVIEAFIPNTHKKPCIDHINTTRTDNRVENLRFCTYEENNNNPITIEHYKCSKKGSNNPTFGKFGAEHQNAKEIVQLSLDGRFIKKWACAVEATRELGISNRHICDCCRGKQKTAGGYRWMYYDDWVKKSKKPSDIKPLF